MAFSVEEIQELGLGQLTSAELAEAFEAFNGFAFLLGRDWLESFFRGMQSARFVRSIIVLWRDWRAISRLPKTKRLLDRWRVGLNEGGVATEVRVFARVLRTGAEIELFPAANNHVQDCRFRTGPSSPWIYVEASARGLSQVLEYSSQVLQRVAAAAADAQPGMHGKVAILRTPSPEEVDRIVAWLRGYPTTGNRLEGLAEFYTDMIESPSSPDDFLEQRVPRPALNCAHIASLDSFKKKGTARLAITDAGADNTLKAEAAQLPDDEVGVVVLDVSRVVGGHQEWAPLIQRRFQPSLHTRVSAVVLMQSSLTANGPAVTGRVLLNAYAKRPIPMDVFPVLESLIR